MRTAFPLAAALLVGAAIDAIPVGAQRPAQPNVRRVIVYGNDACPRGGADELVVCARRPERDRYRIPENLRTPPSDPENESWAARAQALEYVGRTGIQSCSPVGPGGVSGCWEEMMRRYRAERQAGAEDAPPPR